jgi:hypothetical protein
MKSLKKQMKVHKAQKVAAAVPTFASATLLAVLVALTSACAPGFEASTSNSCGAQASCINTPSGGDSGGGGGIGGGNPGGNTGKWDSISLDGSINGGRFDQAKVVEIDTTAKTLVLRLPFIAGIQIGAQLPLPIAEVPGATIGIEPGLDGSSSLVLRIPLEKVLRGVDVLPRNRLPNGDALPAIPEGELPSVGLSFTNSSSLRGALYLSPTVVGLFINTKFDPYIRLTLPIRDEARTRTLGYFTSIPAKADHDGGFFLSIALPDDLARAIDDLL